RLARPLHRAVTAHRHGRLTAQEDLAGRAGAERKEELSLPDLRAVDLYEEVEQPALRVVARHVEGVEINERPRRLVGEAGDLLGVMDQRGLRGDLVDGRKTLDPALALAAAGHRAERRAGELREIEQALLVHDVEPAMRIGGADHEGRDDRSVDDHRYGDDRGDARSER